MEGDKIIIMIKQNRVTLIRSSIRVLMDADILDSIAMNFRFGDQYVCWEEIYIYLFFF